MSSRLFGPKSFCALGPPSLARYLPSFPVLSAWGGALTVFPVSTILVTGAAGFIGSHTCDQLLAGGHTVVGVDNFRTGRRENLREASRSPRFRFEELDITAPDTLASLAEATRPDAIVHLAALVSVQESIADPELNFRLNVAATHTVGAAARVAGVKRLVFASSASVYGDVAPPLHEESPRAPISPYGGGKLASEDLLLCYAASFGFTARCLRYFNVFGPRQDPRSPYSGVISIFADKFRAGLRPTVFGDGEQTRDFISVSDVARANVLAATRPTGASGAFNICSGKPTSLNRLIEVLRRIVPHAPEPIYAPGRAGDIRHSLGAAVKAARELGFVATTSLEAGLTELIQATAAEQKEGAKGTR